jgi:hypothetical protein
MNINKAFFELQAENIRLIGCLPDQVKQSEKIKAIRKLNRLYGCVLISPEEFRKLLNLIFEI